MAADRKRSAVFLKEKETGTKKLMSDFRTTILSLQIELT